MYLFILFIRLKLIKPDGSVVVLMENEYDDHDNNNNFLFILLSLLHATDRRMDRRRCGWLCIDDQHHAQGERSRRIIIKVLATVSHY